FVPTEDGITKIIKPNAKKYIEIASNKLPGDVYGTPAITDDKIYYRSEGYLFCIGK
ncbi:MAG: hypothetical protein HQL32_11635, partial [Planctomycetes bacterium]|nr:hypothetical protein [Planctomycetota bacterium]